MSLFKLMGFFAPATLVSLLISSPARADIYKDALQKRLAFIFKDEQLAKTDMSVQVYSLNRQDVLFSLYPDKVLNPASAIKLLTGFVALKKLGPNFTFKTTLHTDGALRDGVLDGNLYLKGGGDAALVTERLYLILNELKRLEVKRIKGQILVDDTLYDKAVVGRLKSNTDRAYNAPISSLSFNYNTTTVYFRPGEKVGDPVKVFVEPDCGWIRVDNRAKTGSSGTGNKLVASRVAGKNEDVLTVSGQLGVNTAEQRSYFNITQPALYAGEALRFFLKNEGIAVDGKEIQEKPVPASARKIAELESLPLREIVTLMNKFSNNFIADGLMKALGKEFSGSVGSLESGAKILREEATRMGMNTAGFHLVSGSGLTRENRASSAQFIKLLQSAWIDFDVLPELLSSIPIAARDGTLRSRMKGTLAAGRLRGKTGTMDDVSSLVGVVQSKGGELLAFSVIMNDSRKGAVHMRPWQNYFGQALADFNRQVPLPEKPNPILDDAIGPTDTTAAPSMKIQE